MPPYQTGLVRKILETALPTLPMACGRSQNVAELSTDSSLILGLRFNSRKEWYCKNILWRTVGLGAISRWCCATRDHAKINGSSRGDLRPSPSCIKTKNDYSNATLKSCIHINEYMTAYLQYLIQPTTHEWIYQATNVIYMAARYTPIGLFVNIYI